MKNLSYLTIFLCLIPLSASAINKCVDASGKIYFQDMACPKNTTGEKIKVHGESAPYSYTQPVQKNTESDPRALLADSIMSTSTEVSQGLIDMKLMLSEIIRSPGGDEASSCFDRYKTSFKDPSSAYIVESAIYEDKSGEVFALVDVSARNGFGGAARTKLICTIKEPLGLKKSK